MIRRTLRTSVRMTPSSPPLSINFSVDEHEVIKARADALGTSQSDLLRRVLASAADGGDLPTAAALAHLTLSEWVRVVVLEAFGITHVQSQVERAKAGLLAMEREGRIL